MHRSDISSDVLDHAEPADDRSLPALQRRITDVIAEYDQKAADMADALAAFTAAGDQLKTAATVGGTWGQTNIETGRVYESTLRESLLKSAWWHIYTGLNIDRIASADDKRKFDQAMSKPPEFTIENIRATFGHYVQDPRGNILRGLAEVFCALDPFYKSHDRVKIGVAGLPKRVVVQGVGAYQSYGRDKIRDMLNALAAFRGEPLVEHAEFNELDKLHRIMGHVAGTVVMQYQLPANGDAEPEFRSRGVTINKFKNGNAHLIFDKAALRDINRALAEFYGDVLPDTTDEKPDAPRESREVAKDLQYYPTPRKVVDRIVRDLYRIKGKRILEPSCGCGRFMDALRAAGADVGGIEVDPRRAEEARSKGHWVTTANFLETVPVAEFDMVVMNPPFYGKHYAKHVRHALRFLKPGGTLIAILPITARYDHGLLDGKWDDLPVGSFAESGTNINTTVLTIHVPEAA